MVDVWLLVGGRFQDTAQDRVAALATWPLTSPGRDGASLMQSIVPESFLVNMPLRGSMKHKSRVTGSPNRNEL